MTPEELGFKAHILIIEDSEDHLLLIERSLKGTDFHFESAQNLQEAREKYQKNLFHMVLTDYRLPDGEGTDFLKVLQGDEPIPLVLMTSQGSEEVAVQALKLGVADYIVKDEKFFQSLPQKIKKTICTFHHNEKLKKFHRELEKKNEALMKVNREKDELLSIVSHDLKNPLGFVVAAADSLLEKDSELSSDSRDVITRMRNNATIGISLISDILDLGKLENTSVHLNYESFEIGELFKTITQSVAYQAEEKNISIQILQEKKIEVKADYGRLFQLYSNLITNSIKYSPEGSSIQIAIDSFKGRRKTDNHHDILKVSVIDNGRGIAKESAEVIFNKYHQTEKDDSKNGAGLGLAICKRICTLHKGKIWVESDGSGKGSTFITTLPVAESIETKKPVNQIKILLADDSEDIQLLVGEDLESLGHEVVTVKNGQEALDQLQSGNFALAFLDFKMPVMSGMETLKRIRSDQTLKNIPVVLMSNEVTPSELQEINRLANEFTYKPASQSELKEKIERVLGSTLLPQIASQTYEKTILIVDDEEEIRSMLVDELSDESIRCYEAKNSYEALFLFNKYHFDLILTDLKMPKMTGIDFVKYLQREKNTLPPIIFISGFLSDFSRSFLSSINTYDLITKPFSLKEVRTKALKLIDENKTEKKHVLMIDDSTDLHFLVKRIIRDNTVQIHIADTGTKGIGLFLRDDYDLILMDGNLPDMKGTEVTTIIKEIELSQNRDNTPVVAFTASQSDEKELLATGCIASLRKPLNIKTFQSQIHEILKKEKKAQAA